MKPLSDEIKKELKEELPSGEEVALLFTLKEEISPRPEFVKDLKNKLTGDSKNLTLSPWQIFFVRGRVFAGLVLLLVTTPFIFILVKNNSYLKTSAPAGEENLEQSSASIKDTGIPEGSSQSGAPSQNAEPAQLKTMVAPSALSFEKVRQIAQRELGIPLGQITVTSYEEKTWPNTCLGLPKKSSNCLAIDTPGFLVTLQAGTSTVMYRTDKEEKIILRQ
jgi:hypothetical protein